MTTLEIPTLATDRLKLRAFHAGDLDAYAAMQANPEVMRYLLTGRTSTRAEVWRTMATSLGGKIRRHRQEKGYSLDKLAEITESSKSYLWELENRDTRKPSAEKLTRIAQALSVTTDYLLDESATPNEEVLKEAFFRKFSKLDIEDQKKIEQMIDVWGKRK